MEVLAPYIENEAHPLQSAYAQLKPVERAFVDAYISELQKSANSAGKRVVDFIMETGTTTQRKLAAARGGARLGEMMLSRALVRAAITERVNQLTEAMDLAAHRVLAEIAALATSNIINFFDITESEKTGAAILAFNPAKATPEQWATVKSIKVKETEQPMLGTITRTYEVELHPKLTALDIAAKMKGMYERDNAQKLPVPVNGNTAALPASTSVKDAADLYARTLKRGTG